MERRLEALELELRKPQRPPLVGDFPPWYGKQPKTSSSRGSDVSRDTDDEGIHRCERSAFFKHQFHARSQPAQRRVRVFGSNCHAQEHFMGRDFIVYESVIRFLPVQLAGLSCGRREPSLAAN